MASSTRQGWLCDKGAVLLFLVLLVCSASSLSVFPGIAKRVATVKTHLSRNIMLHKGIQSKLVLRGGGPDEEEDSDGSKKESEGEEGRGQVEGEEEELISMMKNFSLDIPDDIMVSKDE
eukprot:752470-Hanusia_phi.AAC.7